MKRTGGILLMIVALTFAGGVMLMVMLLTTLAAATVRKPGVQQAATADLLPANEMSSSPSGLGSSS